MNTPESHAERKSDLINRQNAWRRYLFLRCLIFIPLFFILFWFLNKGIPLLLPGTERYLQVSISMPLWGGDWILEIFIAIFLFFGFTTLKYGNLLDLSQSPESNRNWVNPLFQVSPLQAGLRYGCILLLLIPVQIWCSIGPFIRYLTITHPVIYPSTYLGTALLLFTYGFLVASISSLFRSPCEKRSELSSLIPEFISCEGIESPMQPRVNGNDGKYPAAVFKRWISLSGYVFPVSLGILLGYAILFGTKLTPPTPSLYYNGITEEWFVFPSSFVAENGPLWAVMILLFSGYLALMASAFYLLAEPVNRNGTALSGVLFPLLLSIGYLSPIPADGMKSVLITQGVADPWLYSPLDLLIIIAFISLVLGYWIPFIDRRITGKMSGDGQK